MKARQDMTCIEWMWFEYSDLHKSVIGVRPTHEHYIEMSQWSDEQLEAEFNRLVALLPDGKGE